jgi:hypothetical protein
MTVEAGQLAGLIQFKYMTSNTLLWLLQSLAAQGACKARRAVIGAGRRYATITEEVFSQRRAEESGRYVDD